MHFSIQTIALTATMLLLPGAEANFDVYRVVRTRPYAQGGSDIIWQFFATPPDCNQALNGGDLVTYVKNSYDVSGNKLGVRCQGSGCAQQTPADNIDVLEMHLSNNPLLHWMDGNTYGNCIVFPNADYDCDFTDSTGHLSGRRKFRCLTNRLGPT